MHARHGRTVVCGGRAARPRARYHGPDATPGDRPALPRTPLSRAPGATHHTQGDTRAAREMLAAAMDAGVNFFDNAEAYARGQSEVVMGEAIRALKWPRLNFVVSTKFF